jgi:hypothetical protein
MPEFKTEFNNEINRVVLNGHFTKKQQVSSTLLHVTLQIKAIVIHLKNTVLCPLGRHISLIFNDWETEIHWSGSGYHGNLLIPWVAPEIQLDVTGNKFYECGCPSPEIHCFFTGNLLNVTGNILDVIVTGNPTGYNHREYAECHQKSSRYQWRKFAIATGILLDIVGKSTGCH